MVYHNFNQWYDNNAQVKLTLIEGLRKNSSSFCLECRIDARNEDLAEHLSTKKT